jgi:hypothetical protein
MKGKSTMNPFRKSLFLIAILVPIFLVLLGIRSRQVIAQSTSTLVPIWTTISTGSYPGKVALDCAGNVYVMGSAGSESGYTTWTGKIVKYSASGEEIWEQHFSNITNGYGYEGFSSMAVDCAGNVAATGYFMSNGTAYDMTTVKYDPTGDLQWVRTANGSAIGNGAGAAVAFDPSGNILAAGRSAVAISEGGWRQKGTLIKYDSTGNQLWSQYLNEFNEVTSEIRGLAVDSLGNALVSGYEIRNGGVRITAKYDTEGIQLWSHETSISSQASSNLIAVDHANNVYVTFEDLISFGLQGYTTIKYSPDGNELWVSHHSPLRPDSYRATPKALVADTSGSVYVTGYAGWYDPLPDYREQFETVKYDSNGNEVWVRSYMGPSVGAQPSSIALDSEGNVYVVGESSSLANCDNQIFHAFTIIKYDSDGDKHQVLRNEYYRSGLSSIAIDSSDSVYVTGGDLSSGRGGFVTIKYAQDKFHSASPEIQIDRACIHISEGQLGTNGGHYADISPDSDVTFTASVGNVTMTGTTSGAWEWSYTAIDGSSQSQIVTITASNSLGGIATTTFQLIVDNVAPSVDVITVPSNPVDADTSVVITATFSDLGIEDVHTADWDWGDNTTSEGAVTEINGSGIVNGSHIYWTTGIHTVTLTVTDNDGASSQSTTVVNVSQSVTTLGLFPQSAPSLTNSPDLTLVITGAGFSTNSVVLWYDSATNLMTPLATSYLSPTKLSAVVPGSLLTTMRTIEIRVFDSSLDGGISNLQPFFTVSAEGNATVVGTSVNTGTNPAVTVGGSGPSTPGSTSVEASGNGAIIIAQYSGSPLGTVNFQSADSDTFFDVYAAQGSSFDAVTIVACNLKGGAEIWWNNPSGAWTPVVPQSGVNNGCITMNLDSASSPSIAQLSGTIFGVVADQIPPSITVSAAKADNTPYISDTWTRQSVTVHFTCSDNLDGSGMASCPADQVFNADGIFTASGITEDEAGNAASASFGPIKIDKTPPALNPTFAPTPVYLHGAATIVAGATDAIGSEIASQSCSNLDTNTVGPKSVVCIATDNAGNSTSQSIVYHVIYRFDGFLQPINDTAHSQTCGSPCPVSIFKGGSTVPAKFQIKDAKGSVVQAIGRPVWLTPQQGGPTSVPVDESYYSDPGTSGSNYEWDGMQYHYNWKTKGLAAGYYWRIGVTLDDGQTYYVYIGLR